ncbi:ferredoxin--NADP reductase [Mucilaginibacter psychrotolerans]|uniref:Ferredoxin--NADP reductase n=1 Tax=Mucilaginibacter psychrotolerans TaxID=1524096 RepID=A0A4Y8SA74_9SPHI|nr:ferredoxin--NADP reductase [Mucilaginibacter psychrotolerans]TFF35535.1 ferredoxin--NADP reductase [Mucilaginibacter psychrotolerans]
MRFFTLKVVEVRTETADTVTVAFKQPGLKKVKYQAGQYLTLMFRINGRRYIRPYSFSSAPLIDVNLEVTIKRLPGGVVSNHIIDTLKVDDMVEVMEPMGDFTLNEAALTPSTHIVLWGAGSGITPLMSIAKYALHKNLAAHVTLVYGNRNAESVIFLDKIKALQTQFGSHFSAWHFHTQPAIAPENPNLLQGRINPEKVLSVMKSEDKLANTIHYICGPSGLKESVRAALTGLGVSVNNVYSEDFEVVRDPAEFEGIITRSVSVTLNGVTNRVEVVKGKSILEAGLDALLDMPYSCQTGNCLVCKGRVVKGGVKMIGVQKLPEGLAKGESLLCSSFPLTDGCVIEID